MDFVNYTDFLDFCGYGDCVNGFSSDVICNINEHFYNNDFIEPDLFDEQYFKPLDDLQIINIIMNDDFLKLRFLRYAGFNAFNNFCFDYRDEIGEIAAKKHYCKFVGYDLNAFWVLHGQYKLV